MSRIILCVFIIVAFASCSKDEDGLNTSELSGKWNLIEQYSDPGDGSGDFMPVESERTIEFFINGTLVSNGSLCSMGITIGEKIHAVFNEETKTISPKNECNSSEYTINYQLKNGRLQLWYPCIEGCAQKYKKIE